MQYYQVDYIQEKEKDMFNIKQYVNGFVFNIAKNQVAVIQKNRPTWQAGKYNGIGGKIELGEFPIEAMIREFYEEAGVQSTVYDWHAFAHLSDNLDNQYRQFECTFFYSTSIDLNKLSSMTDEQVFIWDINDITIENSIPNLTWLIPMALSLAKGADKVKSFEVAENL